VPSRLIIDELVKSPSTDQCPVYMLQALGRRISVCLGG